MSKKAKIPTVSKTIQMLKDGGSFDSEKFKKYKRKLQYIGAFCMLTAMGIIYCIGSLQGSDISKVCFLFSTCTVYGVIAFYVIREFRYSFYLANFGESALASVQFARESFYYKSDRYLDIEYTFEIDKKTYKGKTRSPEGEIIENGKSGYIKIVYFKNNPEISQGNTVKEKNMVRKS